MGGSDLSALKTQVAELQKSYNMIKQEAVKAALAAFDQAQKTIAPFASRLKDALAGKTVEFSPSEQATLSAAARETNALLTTQPFLSPENAAALKGKLGTAQALQKIVAQQQAPVTTFVPSVSYKDIRGIEKLKINVSFMPQRVEIFGNGELRSTIKLDKAELKNSWFLSLNCTSPAFIERDFEPKDVGPSPTPPDFQYYVFRVVSASKKQEEHSITVDANAISTIEITFYWQRALDLSCPFVADSQKLVEAVSLVEDFAKNAKPLPIFKGIAKKDLVDDLLKQLKSPCEISNDGANLCGPAAFSVVWAQRNPKEYAQAVIDMYTKGEAKCGNIVFKANSDVFDLKASHGLSPADFVLLPAIRHSENVIPYNPATCENGFWKSLGITTPFEMSWWLKNIEWTAGGIESIDSLNKYWQKGFTTVLLIDLHRFNGGANSKKESVKTHKKADKVSLGAVFGDHYVVLADKITPTKDGNFNLKVLSWGDFENSELSKDDIHGCIKRIWIVEANMTWAETFGLD